MPPKSEDPHRGSDDDADASPPAGLRLRLRDMLRPDRFTGAVGWTMLLRLAGLPLQLLLFLLVARLHDVANVGIFALVTGLWIAARSIGPLGFDSAAMRYIPDFAGRGRDAAVGAFIRLGMAYVGLPAAIVALSFVALSDWSGAILSQMQQVGLADGSAQNTGAAYLVLCGIGLPAYVMIGYLVGVVRACRRVIAAQLPEMVIQPLLGLGLVGAVALGLPGTGVTGTLFAVVTAAWLTMFIYLWMVRADLRGPARLDASERRAVVSAGLRIGVSGTLTVLTLRVPLVVLFVLAGAAPAGLYEAGLRFAMLATLGTWAVVAAVSSLIVEARTAGQADRMRRLIAGSMVAAALPAVGVVLMLVVLGDWLLGWFGPAYSAAQGTAVILALAFLVNTLGGPVGNAFYMIGRERLALGFSTAGAVTMAIAVPIGAALAGPAGAASGFLVALVVRDGGMLALAGPVLGIRLRDLNPLYMVMALARPRP